MSSRVVERARTGFSLGRAVLCGAVPLAVAAWPGLRAQDERVFAEEWRWSRYTTDSGLPSHRVTAIVETTTGATWASTDAGIARFDGYRWRGIPIGRPEAMLEFTGLTPDAEGGVLVSVSGRLFRADAGGAVHIEVVDDEKVVPVASVAALGPADYLLSTGEKLLRLRAGVVEPIEAPIAIGSAECLRRTRAGDVWLTGPAGALRWEGGAWRRHLDGECEGVRSSAGGATFGLGVVPLGERMWSLRAGVARTELEASRRTVAFDVAPDGGVLIARRDGAVIVLRGGSPRELHAVPYPLRMPRCLWFRDSGDLWVGTDRGAYLARMSSVRWTRWRDPDDERRNRVHAFSQTADGTIWYGTRAGVVAVRADGTRAAFESAGGVELGEVTGIASDRQGGIWLCSGGGFDGVFRYLDGQWRHFGPADGLGAPRVHRIAADRSGRLWFLGIAREGGDEAAEPGIFLFDGDRFHPFGGNDELPSRRCYAFVEADDGTKWFGTWGGLSRLRDGSWDHWTVARDARVSHVTTIALDREGAPWFGMGYLANGLGHLDADDVPCFLTTRDGLPADRVYEVVRDPAGGLWAGTADGLCRYVDGSFATFGPALGLDHPQVWPVALGAGCVYVGSIDGGVYVLDRSEERLPPPLVVVSPPVVEGPRAHLRWQAFAYDGAVPPEVIETRFRLDEGPWSPWSSTRQLDVLHASSGEHTLSVQAKRMFGGHAPAMTTARFSVPVPFYLEPLFFAVAGAWLLTLVAMTALFGIRRRRHHAQVRRREEHFRSLIDNASDLIAVVGENGTIRYLSPSSERILGRVAADLAGGDLLGLVHPDDHVEACRLLASPAPGAPPTTLRLKHGDGSWRTLEAAGRTVEAGVVVNARDVTERQQLELQLRQAQKMEALGTLAGGIAHDFNNVLTAVHGFAELTRRALPERHPLRENQDSILRAAARARDLVRHIMTFSRRRGPVLEPVDLRAVVDEAVKLLRATLPPSIEIRREPYGVPVLVQADSTQLQQVLLNLGSNAADAMRGRGGRLDIAVDIALVDAARAARAGLGAAGAFARLCVSDTGHGMEPDTVQRIFDPFFTTKSVGRGTGLGLSAVHGIVTAHGGGLVVDSRPGHGTRFELFFPVSSEVPADPGADPGDKVHGAGHVLFVDDEAVLTTLGHTSLGQLGYRVTAESDSRRALALLRSAPGRFDAIVTDHAMPHLTGLELAREARRLRADIPIVLTSGYGDPFEGDAPSEDVSVFVRKPYSTEQLGRALRRAMRGQARPRGQTGS